MDFTVAKMLISDLLTNDNELFMLDTQASSPQPSNKKANTKLSQINKSLYDVPVTVNSKIVINILYKNKSKIDKLVNKHFKIQ